MLRACTSSSDVAAHFVVVPGQLLIDVLCEALQVEAEEQRSTCLTRGPLFSQVCSQQQGLDIFVWPSGWHLVW